MLHRPGTVSGGSVPRADRLRLILFGLASVAAIAVGFHFVSAPTAKTLIQSGGYYYILALFAVFVFHLVRVIRQGRTHWTPAEWRWAVLVVAAGTAFAVWADSFKHKVLFDEHVLQATAYHMHATKEVGTTIRAYDIQGTWLPIDTFLDKRPYFFAFLLSLLHDLTGFRLANVHVLNVALVPLCLGSLYWLARGLAGRGPASLAVCLLATLPLFGQQASGAGMELHNLTMLAAVAAFAVLYVREPDEARFSLLVTGTILLAQSRYESVIFVVPVAAVVLIGWWQTRRVILPWVGIVAPLLLVPYAWHNGIVAQTPLLWQLQEGQTARFSFEYLAGNLEGAWKFFFNFGPALANSWYLSVLGVAAVAAALLRIRRWARRTPRTLLSPAQIGLAAIATGIVANFVLLMFYYWSRLDDVVASRFALPMCLLLALLVAAALDWIGRRQVRATKLTAIGLGFWVLVSGFHLVARKTYTTENLVMQELEWEHEELRKRGTSLLYVSNKSTIPFVLWRVPTVINGVGRQRGEQIAFHLKEGTFDEVIVAQALRPTSAEGDFGVAPEDVMPASYRLETIAEKRFGARWARLSRLVAIEADAKGRTGAATVPTERALAAAP